MDIDPFLKDGLDKHLNATLLVRMINFGV
jgi:hypothetical protein